MKPKLSKEAMAKQKKAAKTTEGTDQLVQQPSISVTLKKYMPMEWLWIVEEAEDKGGVLYPCNDNRRYWLLGTMCPSETR